MSSFWELRTSKEMKEVWKMYILEYKDGVKSEKLSPKAKANMERCASFHALEEMQRIY